MSKTLLGFTIWLPAYHCLLPRFHGTLYTYSNFGRNNVVYAISFTDRGQFEKVLFNPLAAE